MKWPEDETFRKFAARIADAVQLKRREVLDACMCPLGAVVRVFPPNSPPSDFPADLWAAIPEPDQPTPEHAARSLGHEDLCAGFIDGFDDTDEYGGRKTAETRAARRLGRRYRAWVAGVPRA